jgi:transcriptional regulator with GAF, ATPase, and Fis domain
VKDDPTAVEPKEPGSPLTQSVGLVAHVLTGMSRGTTRQIGRHMTIGKASDNHLVLREKTVSRHHCEFVRDESGMRVRDLGSTNGTRVDGTIVHDAMIRPGAIVRVGQVELAIRPNAQPIEVMPSERTEFGGAIGKSLAMRTLFGVLEYMAPSNATVLLEGETGTGKDVLARAIMKEGRRKKAPFVVVDCGAVTPTLLESELFGHEKGAFTGAVAARRGAFELADGGTLFLDEIGELGIDLQPKLLRALEAREVKRLGGNKPTKVDVRVIAATKAVLLERIAAGQFREDLYFRLAVVPLKVPPLRERREDIPSLVTALLAALGARDLTVSDEAMSALLIRDWPGNVRELRNVLERAALLARSTGETRLELAQLATEMPGEATFRFDAASSYADTLASFERSYVRWLVTRHGTIDEASRQTGVDPAHLQSIIDRDWDEKTPVPQKAT